LEYQEAQAEEVVEIEQDQQAQILQPASNFPSLNKE